MNLDSGNSHELESDPVYVMVIILDVNPEIDARVRNNLLYLICLRHLIRSRAVTNKIVFLR